MLSTNPPKWTFDRYPQEYQVRKYIFDTWRKVCIRFGYQEYLWPLVESAEIWKAKSWEDVGWSELTRITNREWEISDLALRPEMTPTVTRMVAKNYAQLAKPIRYFSIANFYRNERPQRWRNREFWQLNVDMFGADSIYADIEILTLAMSIMIEFNAPKWSWKLHLNNRFIIDWVLASLWITDEIKREVTRLMDKREKLPQADIEAIFEEIWLNKDQISKIITYMNVKTLEELQNEFPNLKWSKGVEDTLKIMKTLDNLWYGEYVEFKSSLIRWFDYYDWMVFEMFDTNPENKRALFGWWRYNWLSKIFIKDDIPAVWFAPGDETTKLFLEWRGMLDSIIQQTNNEKLYAPIIDEWLENDVFNLSKTLRSQGKNIVTWLEVQKFGKAIQYADKQWFDAIVILWENEKKDWIYKIKNLKTWEETEYKL